MRILLLALLGLVACGGDDTGGPSDTNVAGEWRATLSNMNGSGISCNSTSPTLLTISQSGSSFSGSFGDGEITCSGPGGQAAEQIELGTLLKGIIDETGLSMDLGTPEFHLTGSVNGASMSGTAHWVVPFGKQWGTVTLDGDWEATLLTAD